MRMILIAAALLAAAPAEANSCTGLESRATPLSRKADAALIRQLARQGVRASGIGQAITDGKWRVIWATPQEAENGIFFFQRQAKGWRLKGTWGGVVAPGEQADVRSWARNIGAPPRIARCFADRAAAEE